MLGIEKQDSNCIMFSAIGQTGELIIMTQNDLETENYV